MCQQPAYRVKFTQLSQLRPQRFIVVIYIPCLLLISPVVIKIYMYMYIYMGACACACPSAMLTAYLFIHFLIYWCLSDPDRQLNRSWKRFANSQMLRWLAPSSTRLINSSSIEGVPQKTFFANFSSSWWVSFSCAIFCSSHSGWFSINACQSSRLETEEIVFMELGLCYFLCLLLCFLVCVALGAQARNLKKIEKKIVKEAKKKARKALKFPLLWALWA